MGGVVAENELPPDLNRLAALIDQQSVTSQKIEA